MEIGDTFINEHGNKVIVVSDDFTGLGRDIVYAQFTDRGNKKVTKQMILNDKNNLHYCFAIWNASKIKI